MEDDTRMELPGFTTPGHPKEDDRLFGRPGGNVEVVVAPMVAKGTSMPDYRFYLATEYGRFVLLRLQARGGQVVTIPNEGNTDRHVFKLNVDQVQIYPGTYRLRCLVNDQEIFNKSLTIENHPALP